MNGDDFIATLRRRLGNRSVADLPSADIIVEAEAIRKTQLEKARFRPWFLQAEDTTISTVVGVEYVALPTGFLGFDPDDEWSGVAVQDPNDTTQDPWNPIVIDDFNVIKDWYKASTSPQDSTSSGIVGMPQKAGLVGTRLYMRPIPDKIYPLRFRFYKSDTPLVEAPSENLWLQHAHDWWLGELGEMYAGLIVQNMDLVPFFTDLKTRGRQRVYHETIARTEANKSRQQGEE